MHRRIKKRKTNASGNAEDVDTGASGSMTVLTETNFVGSGSSPTETNNSASTGNSYEVFLSFRGPDTRHNFTDHLYHGLLNAGINVFRDDDELRQGENIKPELLAAIKNSEISIPIFSVNYGRSSWCLDELVQIMECKNNNRQIVLPIFYKVKPDEVRYQTGGFGKKFNARKESSLGRSSFNPAILEKWKQALFDVSNLKGYEADGYEAKLVESIVRRVLSELKKKFELLISENLVGIDSHVSRVMEFMDNKSHATLFVGIHGMGGIGKTTLAKVIYNKLSNQFEHRSFIADVRESWKRNGIHYLQNKLVSDILNQKNEVHDQDEGTYFISSKFKGKKVLILIDDVDNVVQLKHLVGNHDWFYPGSRIIITSRNKKILKQIGVDYAYDHKEMDDVHSLILFSKHAFRRDSPSKKFKDLTHEVVSLTGGLPLSLEVLGSLLCGEKPEFWRGTIDKLKEVPCKEVQETLKISYEALDNEQKQIFLDISCFFIGTDSRIASYMWDACRFFPKEGIEVLRFMSLIKIGDDHQLQMHDHLRDLGRTIVRQENHREPQKRSRLWDPEEALKVLKRNKGTDKIEAIDLSKDNSEGSSKTAKQDGDVYKAKQFKNLTSLRFLYIEGVHLSGDFEGLMEELKWLRWQKCPRNFEAKKFHVKELAILELSYSKINEKWEGWSFFMMAKKLKYLDLSYCESLKQTDFLSAFKKLEVLILRNCRRLKRIDASIEELEALLHLELCRCESLTELPAEIGKLTALQRLSLEGARSLSALPDSIGCLKNLEKLVISNCGIEELPNDIGRLKNLQLLRAFGCANLKRIMPKSMCNLSSLRCLDFRYCWALQSLPDLPSGLTILGVTCLSRQLPSLSHLAHLKQLHFWQCGFLKCIDVLPSMQLKSSKCSQPTDIEESKSPQSLNTPFKLEILDFRWCQSMETLDVSQFIHLRTLSVYYCRKLLEVRGLDKSIDLESLTITASNSIERLDLPHCKGLKKLHLSHCKKLVDIQGLNRLKYLESLDIEWCLSIERLNLSKFGRLKELKAKGCKKLVKIQSLKRLEFLESLDISECTSIGKLLLPKSGRLKELKAEGCVKLVKIRGLKRSEFLESLDISVCTSVGKLLLPKSGRLKELNAKGCVKLVKIRGLKMSEFLESLDISKCTSIGKLLLPKSKSLKELKVEGCENLVKIQGLERSKFLERLDIFKCTSIERLDFPKSKRLKELRIGGYKNLAEIEGFDRLECLEKLDIKGCTSIEMLDLPKSWRLKELNARDCKNLVEIQGLDRLEFLEELDIAGCKSLKTIPELFGMRIYR